MQKAKVYVQTVSTTEKNITFDHPSAPFHHDSIIKHHKIFPERITLNLDFGGSFTIPERIHNTGIMSSWYIASDCFLVQQYPATILFSAISIEAVINHDERLAKYRHNLKDSWITLSVKSLKKAKELGFDVSDLLKNNAEFVILRNKVAHGDIAGTAKYFEKKYPSQIKLGYPTGWGITKLDAVEHLQSSFNFLKKWGESNPTILLGPTEEIRT